MAGTGAAFDPLASRYDELWTSAPAGRLQRDAVWRNLRTCFRPDHHILDLGCGTGEDSAWLLAQGIRVTAIDASPAMVSKARERNADARVLKVEEIDRLPGRFSGAISNFGVFNCVASPEIIRASLAARFLPGAPLALCVMGRFCLWETLWFSMRGKFRKAGRRWRGVSSADTLGISVTYHSVAGLRRALAPEFELKRVAGIGIAVPPSYVGGLPAWTFRVFASIDRLIEGLPFIPSLADHRLLIFEPPMIILFHPRAVRPKNRRFPLAILSIAAVLEGREDYVIVDGNLDPDPGRTMREIIAAHKVELIAVSVMPGPQMVSAMTICRDLRDAAPRIPIVWGGYFPSLYTDATLNAPYVDFAIKGQGEETILELLVAMRTTRDFSRVRGLAYKDAFGLHVQTASRSLRSPGDFPELPYHRLGPVERYLLPTFLGKRTAVHHASIGCPYRCQFCGVVPIYDGKQKTERAQRTAATLTKLQQQYGIDAVQFYDNNFFLNESHTRELAELLIPLRLRWWSEGRIDAVLRYSDDTMRALHRAGSAMIFFGAESGSNAALASMNKGITAGQTLELAARIRRFGIIPEFSFVVGNPEDPEGDTRATIDFIRRIKRLNPEAEIIVQHYIPTPHPDGMYGKIDGAIRFPESPEEWASERWFNFTVRQDPLLPWLPQRIKKRIDNFELVINSRWPTVQDIYLPRWSRIMLQWLSSWRYASGFYAAPFELGWAQKFVALRKPRWDSI